jgi:hypothetical protein
MALEPTDQLREATLIVHIRKTLSTGEQFVCKRPSPLVRKRRVDVLAKRHADDLNLLPRLIVKLNCAAGSQTSVPHRAGSHERTLLLQLPSSVFYKFLIVEGKTTLPVGNQGAGA